MSLNKVGVIGAGVMGAGMALDLATHGVAVVLHDIDKRALTSAEERMKSQLRELQFFKKQLPILDYSNLDLTYTKSLSALSDVDFIIENVTESIDVKKTVLLQLNQVATEGTVVAINTSCIPITELASVYQYPDKLLGMHFMNPVPLQMFVEVIRSCYTSDETLEVAQMLLKKLNKTHMVVQDSPGFVSNRLSHLLMNEAAFLVYENIAVAKDIDRLFKEGYGHKMGPLETADLIGLDTVVHSLKVLFDQYQDGKFRCCPLLKKMVSAGKLGRKSGEGFYAY